MKLIFQKNMLTFLTLIEQNDSTFHLSAAGEAAEAEIKVMAVGALDPQSGDVLLAVVARVPKVQNLYYVTLDKKIDNLPLRIRKSNFLTSGTTLTRPTPPPV